MADLTNERLAEVRDGLAVWAAMTHAGHGRNVELTVHDLRELIAALDEVERLRSGLRRIEAIADWHETEAYKARTFRPEIDGENRVMDKAYEVHKDAAARLRAENAALHRVIDGSEKGGA